MMPRGDRSVPKAGLRQTVATTAHNSGPVPFASEVTPAFGTLRHKQSDVHHKVVIRDDESK
jgi:hypothetical protein